MANKKFHIKKGDTVEVIAGADKGSRGEVLEMLPKNNRAIVADVSMVTKHKKPTENDPGGRIEQESSIHISNLMLVDPKSGESTRTGRREEDGKLVRYSKKSGETID